MIEIRIHFIEFLRFLHFEIFKKLKNSRFEELERYTSLKAGEI
jgi:hypothetical protein